MFDNLKKKWSARRFNAQIKDITRTPPMPVIDAPWSIVSMVAKSDVLMYLLSMKSFYRKLGKGKIIAILARDTPSADRSLIEHHFPGIQIEILENIDPGQCQRGGCWERLVYLIRRSQEEYVIQLDCDTLVIGDNVDEIIDRIQRNISFAYADRSRSIKSLREIAAEAEQTDSDYIGILLERAFATWPDADRLKSVRASAALAGFAKGGASLSLLEEFHARMKQSLGARWREWGTEQSASNFMVANSRDAITLPFPQYATYPLPNHDDKAKFFHFIGSNRFRDGYFADQGQKIIADLLPLHRPPPAPQLTQMYDS